MRVNYPNASDQILSDKEHPGFDIYIHGGGGSVGCVPIGDDGIEELYLIAADATQTGQLGPIPIHIFPARMSGSEWERFRQEQTSKKPELAAFWNGLQPGFEAFEKTRRVPTVTVDAGGRYVVGSP
jgi:murein L,D-transpeptidase YafK